MSTVQYFAPFMDSTMFQWHSIFSMLAVCVVLSPKYSNRLLPAVIWVRYGSSFSGWMSTVYRWYVTVLLGGTSVNGIKSNTSMPSVVQNPWNERQNSFPPEVVNSSRIVGLEYLLRSLYAASFFNSSSHIKPPAIATCCTTSACDAWLYPSVYVLVLWAMLGCLLAWSVIGLYWFALFGVWIYNAWVLGLNSGSCVCWVLRAVLQ